MTLPLLPGSVLAKLELSPVEDIMLELLRDDFPDIPIFSLVPENPTFPFILVRRGPTVGEWQGDPRFTDVGAVEIHVFDRDPDGDLKAALISEAVRVALRDDWISHKRIPGRGSVIEIRLTEPPRRAADWSTAIGPVQYADLPEGVTRYESSFHVEFRREL